jgi:DNA repair exonuclease SbcCD ATPase subunit
MNSKRREKEEKVEEKRAEKEGKSVEKRTAKEENCGVCKSNVEDIEKGVQCELCEAWFHCKCEGLQEDTYRLMKQDKIHFYCGRCDKAAGRLLKNVSNLMKRQDKLEEEIKKINETIKIFIDTFSEEAKTQAEKMKKLDKTAEDTKKEIKRIDHEYKAEFKKLSEEVKGIKEFQEDLHFEKQIQQLTEAFVNDTQWTDIVKKEVSSKVEVVKQEIQTLKKESEEWKKKQKDFPVDSSQFSEIVRKEVENKIVGVSEELTSIQKLVEDTRNSAQEEKEKERRANNVIIYNLKECMDPSFDVRQKQDKTRVLTVLRDIIDKDFSETEIHKMFRLGKASGEENKPRPLLVQFVSKMTKNYLMQSLSYLKNSVFKKLVISHDMTLKEREDCKKLVEEAKRKEAQDGSGEWIFRVRGPPGLMKIVRWRKH